MRQDIIKLYKKAQRLGFAIGAFNFSTNEILKGIVNSAMKLKSPVIVSCSEGERHFFGAEESVGITHAINFKFPHVILHADHTKSLKEVKKVVDAGYPSIHFDGSSLAYRDNLRQTKMAVAYAHKHHVFVEGELGGIPGGSNIHNQSIRSVEKEEYMTNPDQAAEFVKETGVDSLAVNIGNAHGIWKDKPNLDFERLKNIKNKTGSFLVLHGGSGISPNDFRKAIKCGINKININTEIRIAYELSLEEGLRNRNDYTPYHYLGKTSRAISKVVEKNMIIFKSEKKI